MNIRDELKDNLTDMELNKFSLYIASSELKQLDDPSQKVLFSSRIQSKSTFYRSEDMDVVSTYKPISRLVDFNKWTDNE